MRNARRYSAINIARYALVEATAISGPARVYRMSSASRLNVEPTTLVNARSRDPRFLARRAAASVSAVSPDWLIATVSVPGFTNGSAYRISWAYSTEVGIRSSRWKISRPTSPAWSAVPHAVIQMWSRSRGEGVIEVDVFEPRPAILVEPAGRVSR